MFRFLHTLVRPVSPTYRKVARQATLALRPTLELLEERTVLSPIYNNAADFSATNNPNGVWSYGDLSSAPTPAASTFSLYGGHGNTAEIDFVGVDNNAIFHPPYVSHNPTNSSITYSTVTYAPGQAGVPVHDGMLSVEYHPVPARASERT